MIFRAAKTAMSPENEQTDKQPEKSPYQYVFNMQVAAIAGQVGCVTLAIVFAALLGGLLLDRFLNTKPVFTIILMVGSVPVTLFAMFWLVRRATARMNLGSTTGTARKDTNRNYEEE
jgi:F0F1-type ATP synthase assembly protein I